MPSYQLTVDDQVQEILTKVKAFATSKEFLDYKREVTAPDPPSFGGKNWPDAEYLNDQYANTYTKTFTAASVLAKRLDEFATIAGKINDAYDDIERGSARAAQDLAKLLDTDLPNLVRDLPDLPGPGTTEDAHDTAEPLNVGRPKLVLGLPLANSTG